MGSHFTVVYDACTLYPAPLRVEFFHDETSPIESCNSSPPLCRQMHRQASSGFSQFVSRAVALAGCLALILAGHADAQIYKSVDKDGRVTYQATPPPAANAKPLAISRSHSANPASGVEVPESTIQYYSVFGDSAHALHTSMVQNGPFNQIVQQRVYAEIEWRYKWKFDYQQSAGKCSIKEFVITLMTTITMPRWMNESTAPPDIRLLWPKVVSKIRKHEDGHKAIAIEGANVLARRLKALPAHDSCQALTTEVNREGDRISREYDLANRAFDRTEALKNSPFDE